VNLLALDHHIAQIDADAELHRFQRVGWHCQPLAGLDLHGALNIIHGAGKFSEQATRRGIDEASGAARLGRP